MKNVINYNVLCNEKCWGGGGTSVNMRLSKMRTGNAGASSLTRVGFQLRSSRLFSSFFPFNIIKLGFTAFCLQSEINK